MFFSKLQFNSKEFSIQMHWRCHIVDYERYLASHLIVLIYETWSCTFVAANEPMSLIMRIVQGRATSRNATTSKNFLFWSFHTWKIKLMPE